MWEVLHWMKLPMIGLTLWKQNKSSFWHLPLRQRWEVLLVKVESHKVEMEATRAMKAGSKVKEQKEVRRSLEKTRKFCLMHRPFSSTTLLRRRIHKWTWLLSSFLKRTWHLCLTILFYTISWKTTITIKPQLSHQEKSIFRLSWTL